MGSSSSSSSSSSANSVVVKVLSPRVFVNFRGEELRCNFISHLRKALLEGGINFFIDEQLVPGEHLETLYKEIDDSRIALAIFSKRYSESKWCLNELLKIMENVEKRKLKVIPIFFNVTVNDVKKQRGAFGMNLYGDSHPDRTDMPKWEKALKSVTALSGLIREAYRSESDFVDDIVKAVKKVQVLISPLSEGGEPTDMSLSVSERSEPTDIISPVPRSKSPEQVLFAKPVYDEPEQLPPAPLDTQVTRKYPTWWKFPAPQYSNSDSDSSYDDLVAQSRNLSLNPTASAAAVTPPKKDDNPKNILFKDLVKFASAAAVTPPKKDDKPKNILFKDLVEFCLCCCSYTTKER